LPNRPDYLWLFFKTSGRLSRAAYLLSFMFMVVVVSFPLYQYMRVMPLDMTEMAEMAEAPLSGAAQMWSTVFLVTMLAFLWAHIATSIKRVHDVGKPGILVVLLFIPVVSIVAFLFLCIFRGDPGPNPYGARTNAPANARD
jgi:uncharacterized membrane protein YhaH (DUF805 family)